MIARIASRRYYTPAAYFPNLVVVKSRSRSYVRVAVDERSQQARVLSMLVVGKISTRKRIDSPFGVSLRSCRPPE
jgi:hypothetical protein